MRSRCAAAARRTSGSVCVARAAASRNATTSPASATAAMAWAQSRVSVKRSRVSRRAAPPGTVPRARIAVRATCGSTSSRSTRSGTSASLRPSAPSAAAASIRTARGRPGIARSVSSWRTPGMPSGGQAPETSRPHAPAALSFEPVSASTVCSAKSPRVERPLAASNRAGSSTPPRACRTGCSGTEASNQAGAGRRREGRPPTRRQSLRHPPRRGGDKALSNARHHGKPRLLLVQGRQAAGVLDGWFAG